MLVTLLMGFSSGLPLLLTGSVLQAWMKDENVDLGTIGLFALVGLPYALKFLWAPLTDRFVLFGIGRRRGWLLVVQLMLVTAVALLGSATPARDTFSVAFIAMLVTLFSATQDIVIDAYRREALSDRELGLGASLYVNGYRVGMLVASGGGLILADIVPFRTVYQLMAILMLIGPVTTLFAPEPVTEGGTPASLREAVTQPFVDYFRRSDAVLILLFILLYKVGDTMATSMTTPFYLEMGFSKTEIGAIVKLFGFGATMLGSLAGGLIMLRIGIHHALGWFGVLQGLSTLSFAVLALQGHNLMLLAAVVALENFSGGMGTSAFVAFMASITNKKFTATQYALLSSLMGVPRVLIAAPTGFLAENVGWVAFFVICALVAVPGLLVLVRLRYWRQEPRD